MAKGGARRQPAFGTVKAYVIARILWSAPGRPSRKSNSSPHRGERSAGRRGSLRSLPGRLARPPETLARRLLIPCDRDEAPPGAPLCGDFWHLKPFFRSATGPRFRDPSGAVATAPSLPSTCSSKIQERPVIVPADGWPKASREAGYEPAPRTPHQQNRSRDPVRRTRRPHLRPPLSPLLRPRHVSGDAPRRAGPGIIYTWR